VTLGRLDDRHRHAPERGLDGHPLSHLSDCPRMPARLTNPTAHAAHIALTPISTRYFVW